MKQLALAVRLRAGAVFESFAPGRNSEILVALRSPSVLPVWLWGVPGSGKTHLLQAACAAAGEAAAYFPLRPLIRIAAAKRSRGSNAPPCYASMMLTRSQAIRTGSGPCSVSSMKPRNCAAV